MMPPSSPRMPDPALERLLSEIFLRMRQERFAEANERLAKAKEIAPEHPAVIEAEGDLAFAQRRYSQALTLFKQAHEADPKNAKLEEKYATAVIKVHEPEYAAIRLLDDSPWSNRVQRPPVTSAFLSAFLPGFGQLYNGDWLKGIIIILFTIFGNIVQLYWLSTKIYEQFHKQLISDLSDFSGLAGLLLHGPLVLLTLLLTAVWIYAVIDAAMVAKNTRG